MQHTSAVRLAVLVTYLALSLYILGCFALEHDVNYPTWHHVAPGDFSGFHQALQRGLVYVLFLPLALQVLAGVALVWLRPRWLPRKLVVPAVLLNVYVVVESLLVQVPMQRVLRHAKTGELVDRLIETHRLYRLPGELAGAAFVVLILLCVVRRADRSAADDVQRSRVQAR